MSSFYFAVHHDSLSRSLTDKVSVVPLPYQLQEAFSKSFVMTIRMPCLLVSSLLDGIMNVARRCITFLLAVDCFGSHGQSEVCHSLGSKAALITRSSIGSGSTYVYGYCDATYQEGWGKDEAINFVKNSMSHYTYYLDPEESHLSTALALAMARDGSSGGVIRMCVITEEGTERLFVPGNELPKFWEGREVLLPRVPVAPQPVPMAVE